MKKTIKSIVCCVVFVALVLYLLSGVTEVLTPKLENRYYVLEDYLENHPEDTLHDLQIFGSCHSYTSFNPIYMQELTGVSSFVYGNAGEIIPVTYARMAEQFRKHTPKVAVVEIWGINPYETYSSHDRVFGFYLANNLERVKFSLAKQEVIRDFQDKEFQDISLLTMNFPFMNYKDRLLDGSLTKLDFDYSFAETKDLTDLYTYKELLARLKNSGYRPNTTNVLADYPQRQNTIATGEILAIEPDIEEYVWKIIDLCKEKNVELIFYRSPYVSTENELKKVNRFKQICDEADVLFLDLEAEIAFDYKRDFLDYQHLSETGANKATEFLLPYIMDAMGEPWERKEIQRENMLPNSDLQDSWKSRFDFSVTEAGIRAEITCPEAGWLLYQDIPIDEALWEESVTLHINVPDYQGAKIAPAISYRDADMKEINTKEADITSGENTVACVLPVGTKYVRIGLYAWEGNNPGDFVVADKIELFQGAFTADNLPTVIN